MYVIYALLSQKKDWIYVGITANFPDRMFRHQQGYEKTTAPYRPFVGLELAISFNNQEARRLEKWYKTSYGKQTIRSYYKENNPPIHGGITGPSVEG